MSTPADVLKTAVIIEDDPDIRRLLAEVLESAGFSTVSVGNGIDGVKAVLTYKPLITTLDVNMPGIDGIEAARRIRASHSDTYIIMLTGMQDEADVVIGLGSGADDYIAKPFRPRELRARIDSILRRVPHGGGQPAVPMQESVGPSFPGARPATTSIPVVRPVTAERPAERPAAPATTVVVPAEHGRAAVEETAVATTDAGEGQWLRHRDLQLQPETRIVKLRGTELELTRTEFDLLATLLESKRRVRSKADLTLVLRGESYVTSYFVGDADKRAIEAHMTNLRRKLGDTPVNSRYIETVRGVGYRMTAD